MIKFSERFLFFILMNVRFINSFSNTELTSFIGKNIHFKHQENMSVTCIPPKTSFLYCKTGVCGGISIFLIFAQKDRGGSNLYPQSLF